jgi:hypothetical protein
MFVVTEQEGSVAEVFCYDNDRDPYQMNRIPLANLEPQTGERLIKGLADLLKNTNDKWYQERICSDILPY